MVRSRTAPEVERKYKLNEIELNDDIVTQLQKAVIPDTELSSFSKRSLENRIITANFGKVHTEILNKVDKEEGKSLTTNDFTSSYKSRIDTLSDDYIKGLGDGEIYSTEEKIIGKWIDNKSIYRKVYSGGSVRAGQHYTIPIDADFDTIVNCYGNISGNNSLIGTTFNYIPLNFYNEKANYLYCEKGKIEYHVGWDCDNSIIILEYTKKGG